MGYRYPCKPEILIQIWNQCYVTIFGNGDTLQNEELFTGSAYLNRCDDGTTLGFDLPVPEAMDRDGILSEVKLPSQILRGI